MEFETRAEEDLPSNVDSDARPDLVSKRVLKELSIVPDHQMAEAKPLKMTGQG